MIPGLMIQADILRLICYRAQKRPYVNKCTAQEALGRCMRILSLQRIFEAMMHLLFMIVHDIDPEKGSRGRYKINENNKSMIVHSCLSC